VKKLLLASVCALASWSASAADLPTKAPQFQPALSLSTGGFYFGAWTTGGMGSVQGSALQGLGPGVNPATVTAVEAGVGGLVGYLWNLPNSCATCFVAAEGWFGWSNINGNTAGFSFSGPLMAKERLLYGADTATIAAAFPQLFPFPVPPFPGTLGNITNIKPYVYASIDEDDISLNVPGLAANKLWSVSPEFGLGMKGQVSASVAVDVFAGVKLPQKGVCIGTFAALGCAGLGTTAVVGLALDF
jgi:hypothetical protein